jgi:hypothetical protein
MTPPGCLLNRNLVRSGAPKPGPPIDCRARTTHPLRTACGHWNIRLPEPPAAQRLSPRNGFGTTDDATASRRFVVQDASGDGAALKAFAVGREPRIRIRTLMAGCHVVFYRTCQRSSLGVVPRLHFPAER